MQQLYYTHKAHIAIGFLITRAKIIINGSYVICSHVRYVGQHMS